MLRNCIEVCPDDLWESGTHPRTFWRIAYHTIFFTNFYLAVDQSSGQFWEKHCWHGLVLGTQEGETIPPEETTYRQGEVLEYLAYVEENVEAWLDQIDLDAPTSGFSWYPIPKLDHQLVNIRHLGTHIGQLQELLYARNIDTDWVGRG